MKIRRKKTLVIRKYKTVNALSPNLMKTILPHKKIQDFDLLIYKLYGLKSFMALGPKIRNALPENVKKEISFSKFKKYIKSGSGPTCKCKMCLGV